MNRCDDETPSKAWEEEGWGGRSISVCLECVLAGLCLCLWQWQSPGRISIQIPIGRMWHKQQQLPIVYCCCCCCLCHATRWWSASSSSSPVSAGLENPSIARYRAIRKSCKCFSPQFVSKLSFARSRVEHFPDTVSGFSFH